MRIFESGAILEYLVTRYDNDRKVSYPHDSTEYWETVSWLTWQMAGVGPMQGQAAHFARSAGEHIPYALNRYVHETRRLYRVGAYSFSGLSSIDEFPPVKKWYYALLARPGFEEGRNAPGPDRFLKMNDMSDEELKEVAASLGTWVLDAMKRAAEA
ncbi:Glutathione S-transferase-like protein tpcF [Colletotrichum orbiculare MAFF 240422]|uniref:Glutathione S-transferase-like protein tpcF n=1 Tax=Colletotrichum orbiculare (strain 104-T / ATCC 96160 / CBS 514.97 / LARS 414 / MAFF 240422) TaxID=1213857 RepID=A0A484G2U8_COLOR|nr:Glutathione S-transferase-like protein tpcF [Colletotrichum orbiculare MAFF 240422]